MKIFVNILTIIVFLIVFVGLYFILERWKKSDAAIRRNYSKPVMNFIEGNIYSIFGILTQILLFQTKQFAQPYIYIVMALTLVFLRNAVIACYSLIGSMLYSMFAYPLDDIFYYVIAIMFISMILTALMKTFIRTKISILINIAFLLVNIFVLWLVALLALNYNFTTQFILATLLPFVLSIILILIISFLLNFLRSANILYESSTYDVLKFYREPIYDKIIQEDIVENKTLYGLFIIFEFDWKRQTELDERKFTLEALRNIQERMLGTSILFKADKKRYGLFTPVNSSINLSISMQGNAFLKRQENDVLKVVENLISDIQGEYIVEETKNKLKARAGAVLYGVQEQNIEKMITSADFALESSRWNSNWNSVTLFDPILFKRKASDYIAITDMDQTIGISSISNTFQPIYDIKNKKTILNVAVPTTTDVLDVEYESLLKYSEYMGSKSILLSFNAAHALKATNGWRSSPISVNYSLEKIMREDFKVEELIASIKRFEQSKRNVILDFDYNEISKYPIIEIVKKMRNLKVNKIQYSIFNFKIDEHVKLLSRIKPDFISLHKTLYNSLILSQSRVDLIDEIVTFAKVIKAKVIISNIEKERELSFVLKTKINYIGGPIFNRDKIEPLLFNKKSKIYIEQIQKEAK